ncbi:MAG: carboxypeptidase regulatory-like domain-containing protein [Bacteroidetes bacterium]|nr:carboxypeptidase regulatory-like domain-containing protein [Bacteroidota bacterium]
MKYVYIMILFLGIFPGFLSAQTGSISGKITDDMGANAITATILVLETNYTTITSTDGQYEIKDLSPGKYTIIFNSDLYRPDTIKQINVKAGKNLKLNISMVLPGHELEEIEITGLKQNSSNTELIHQIKNSDGVISGISAEQINKGQDRDATDAVKRIPGVTLNNGRLIVVRGLNERYNSVWLNNITAPSTEPDKKSFSFDILPTSMIDQIIIYKTPTAELPGDFAGGMVKIFTKTPALAPQFTFDLNGFYRPGTTFNTLQFTQGSKTDLLGYDNGFRSIPKGVPNIIETTSPDITRAFKNTWVSHNATAVPDFRFGICYSQSFKIRKLLFGSVTAIAYSYSDTLLNVTRKDYSTPSATIVPTEPTSVFKDVVSSNLVKVAGIQNFSLLINPRNKIEFKNLFTQLGRNQTILSTGDDEGASIKHYSFGYQSRTLFSSQLGYDFSDKLHKNAYNCSLGYSLNKRNDPDLRRINYQYPPDTFYRSNIPPGSGQLDVTDGATRFFSKLNEHIYSFNQNYKHTFNISGYHFDINIGSLLEYKDRVFTSRLFGYLLPVSALRRTFTGLPINEIFSDQYINVTDTLYGQRRQAGFRIGEQTNPQDSYTGKNQLIAPYISGQFSLFKKINLVLGLRAEDNTQFIHTVVGADTVNISNHTRFYLPSINLKYDLTKKSLLRFAYGKTLNRPEFREWAPFLYYDFELMALSHGSLFPSVDHPKGFELKTATIQNYDLRYELYPGTDEMLTIGGFYKFFSNSIEQVAEAHEHRTGVSQEIVYRNFDKAYCYGLELEFRKNLSVLNRLFNVNFFQNISLIANSSIVNSRVHNVSDTLIKPRQMQGQAPYLVNAGLYYANKERATLLECSIVYNIIGSRIVLAGGTDGPHTASGPSIGEMPRHGLDVTLKKNINSHISINLGVQDLLNQPVLLLEDTNQDGKFSKKQDKEVIRYKKGAYYSVGIKILL